MSDLTPPAIPTKEQIMKLKQILIVTAAVILSPIAAQAAHGQKYGEAYPLDVVETQSTLSRAEVRDEVLSLNRNVQNYGEAYPFLEKDPMTMRLAAEVRREARNAPRMYGEISGDVGHN
jgi:hypothetical protein